MKYSYNEKQTKQKEKKSYIYLYIFSFTLKQIFPLLYIASNLHLRSKVSVLLQITEDPPNRRKVIGKEGRLFVSLGQDRIMGSSVVHGWLRRSFVLSIPILCVSTSRGIHRYHPFGRTMPEISNLNYI